MSKKNENSEKLIEELEALDNDQDRIDRVAEDFISGKNIYSSIDAWKLGELLGLDFKDTADCGPSSWAFRRELEDADYEHPFAENIGLLEGKIPQERYKHLTAQALEIVQKSDGPDLLLSDDEGRQLRDAYVREQVDLPDLQRALFSLKSSSGIELDFEVCIGDGGEPFDERSPYELRDGKGFNSDLYIEVE
jgi:hypothetical protein